MKLADAREANEKLTDQNKQLLDDIKKLEAKITE